MHGTASAGRTAVARDCNFYRYQVVKEHQPLLTCARDTTISELPFPESRWKWVKTCPTFLAGRESMHSTQRSSAATLTQSRGVEVLNPCCSTPYNPYASCGP